MSDNVDDFSVEQEDLLSQIVDNTTETLNNDVNDINDVNNNNNSYDMDYNYNMNMENRLDNVEIQISSLSNKLDILEAKLDTKLEAKFNILFAMLG